MNVLKKQLIETRIKEGLESSGLDSASFEKAACRLLDHHLMTNNIRVVHIKGDSSGRDNGFDGEARHHDDQDHAPVIVTTSKDPLKNLKKNLDRVIGDGNKSKKVYFAYRNKLTAKGVNDLKAYVKTKNRTLHYYDLDWFVEQLQLPENQGIYSELLRSTDIPVSLTDTTDSMAQMPELKSEFLGREDEIDWINKQENDCLVLGQPGMGKTSLLGEFIKKGNTFFLTEEPNVYEIADWLKNNKCIIVVDDAHNHIKDLKNLMRVRQERHCQFRIVAISWPYKKDAVMTELGLGTPCKELTILDGKTIVAIVKSIKLKEQTLRWPTAMLNTIRQQANGKPGLAITLAAACLKDQPQNKVIGDVLTGEILRQYLFGKFDNSNTQEQIKHVLAAFALGGKAGVTNQAILKFLELKPDELVSEITILEQYAVLENYEDRNEQPFSIVVPQKLQGAVAATYFFNKPATLNYRDLEVRNKSELVRVMIEARSRGAAAADLENLIQDSTIVDSTLMANYAELGEREAQHAMKLQPGNLSVLEAALYRLDTLVLPKLLENFKNFLAKHADNTLQFNQPYIGRMQTVLNQWIVDGVGYGMDLKRQQKLTEAMAKFAAMEENFAEITDQHLAVAGVFSLVLCPTFSIPTAGATLDIMTIDRGCLSGDILQSRAQIWEPFLRIIKKLHEGLAGMSFTGRAEPDAKRRLWNIVQQAVGYWTFDITKRGLAEEDQDFMKQQLSVVLPQVLSMAKDEWGYIGYFGDIAKGEGIELNADLSQSDSTFNLIFSGWGSKEKPEVRKTKIDKLVTNNVKAMTYKELAVWLDNLCDERHGDWADMGFFRHLCKELAKQIKNLDELVNELFVLRPNSRVAIQLLGFMAQDANNDNATLNFIDKCLEQSETRHEILHVLIGNIAKISDAVFKHIETDLDEDTEALQHACYRQSFESCRERLHKTLTHSKPSVALCCAIGLWQKYSLPKQIQDPSLYSEYAGEWKKAVLGSIKQILSVTDNYHTGGANYWIAEILADQKDLAIQWMKAVLESKVYLNNDLKTIFKAALPNLDSQQRIALLAKMQWDESSNLYNIAEIFSDLINQDAEVYREALGRDEFKEFLLEPLRLEQSQTISPEWKQMAKTALEQGKTPGEITSAVLYYKGVQTGSDSEVLSSYLEKLSVLQGDTELHQVYEAAKKYLEPKIKKAQREEIAQSNR